jgi:UDPglucose 6-dehydrogenase
MSVELCKWIKDQGAEVTAFDPAIQELPQELLAVISLSADLAGSVETADCIIVATKWPDFQKIETDIITTMRRKTIIDPNGFMEVLLGNVHTIQYFAVGRSCL